MYHLLSQDVYRKNLQHLDIIGVNSLSSEELELLGIKYNFDITDVSSEQNQVLDFYEVLDERSRDQNLKMQGLRSDFTNKFRALGSWDPHLPEPTLHAEVKLCLNVLQRQREKVLLPRTLIGVSKQACFLCETFFEGLNATEKTTTMFTLSPGHLKIYAGWKFSGIENADGLVKRRLWALIDDLIVTTIHRESKDTIIPLKAQSDAGEIGEGLSEDEKIEFKDLVENLKVGNWYLPLLSIELR